MIPGLLTLISHAFAAFAVTRLIVITSSRVCFCLGYYLFFSLQILIYSKILSAFGFFGTVWAWASLEAIALSLVILLGSLCRSGRERLFRPLPGWKEVLHPGPLATLSLRGLVLGVGSTLMMVLLLAAQLYFIFAFAPRNWDSNTCHLVRMAMALQEGHLAPFKTTWDAHNIHPTGSICLHGFAYLTSGQNEKLLQIVNWVSYLVAMVSIYGSCRLLKIEPVSSLLAGIMFGLLTICILQSISTQTDMLFCGWIGVCLYFLLSFCCERDYRHLGLSAVAATLPLLIKSSGFLIFPALGVVAVYLLCIASTACWKTRWKDLGAYTLFGLLSFLLLIVPHGYWQNFQRYGHPMGPADFLELHSFKGRPVSAILKHGSVNILRYGYSFFRLDGQPPERRKLQPEITSSFQLLTQKVGIDLNDQRGLRVPIWPYTQCVDNAFNDEDASWWGILGFLVIWPSVICSLVWPKTPGIVRAFGMASIVYFLTQAYSGPYDPWRGRYFIHCALFALPCVGLVFSKFQSRLGLLPLIAVMLLGFDSARFTAQFVYRMDIRQQTRLEQITLRNPDLNDPLVKFESVVPPDSTISYNLPGDYYLYPFFGLHLSRKLYSAVDSSKARPSHNPQADFYLFHADREPNQPGDIALGANLYLRDLKHPAQLARRPE